MPKINYRMCPAALAKRPTPHDSHFHGPGDQFRCIGAPERDDRARTFNPKARL